MTGDHKETHWFAVQLRPNGLKRAEINLHHQGFTLFLPRRAETVRRRGRLRAEARPLFPGYLFVSFDPETTQWRRISSTFGVSRLVMRSANTPARVPPGLIEALASRCDGNGLIVPSDEYVEGDVVRLVQGPFAGTVAMILALGPSQRLELLLEMMGREVRTRVAAEAVERAAI